MLRALRRLHPAAALFDMLARIASGRALAHHALTVSRRDVDTTHPGLRGKRNQLGHPSAPSRGRVSSPYLSVDQQRRSTGLPGVPSASDASCAAASARCSCSGTPGRGRNSSVAMATADRDRARLVEQEQRIDISGRLDGATAHRDHVEVASAGRCRLIPIADRSPLIVVGIRQTSSETRTIGDEPDRASRRPSLRDTTRMLGIVTDRDEEDAGSCMTSKMSECDFVRRLLAALALSIIVIIRSRKVEFPGIVGRSRRP